MISNSFKTLLGELMQLNRSQKKMFVSNLKAIEQSENISMNHQLALIALSCARVKSMSDLCKEIGISNQQATRVIDDLVERGYVTRERDEKNLRSVCPVRTERAIELHNKSVSILHDNFLNVYKENEEEKLKELINALKTINSFFKDLGF